MEFHQTWYRGAPPGVDELIRFWARSAQRQGSKVNELGLNMLFFPPLTRNLKKPWVDFHQTWYRGAPLGVDELMILGEIHPMSKVKVNELGLICYFYLVNAKSQDPLGGFSSNDMANPAPPPPPQFNFFFNTITQV